MRDYFELGPVVQETLLKRFLSRDLVALTLGGAGTFKQFW